LPKSDSEIGLPCDSRVNPTCWEWPSTKQIGLFHHPGDTLLLAKVAASMIVLSALNRFEINDLKIGVFMRKDIHPNFRPVVFKDISCDYSYLTKSTAKSKETIVWEDGKEYPVVKFEVSSASHPFYTGKHRIVDAEGRAEKFKKKYGKKA
jgi:large subunit ribosomal protein L31